MLRNNVADSNYYHDKSIIVDLTEIGEIETDVNILAKKYTYINGTKSTVSTRIKSTNKNLFDEQIELGTISTSTGENAESETNIRGKNFVKVKAVQSYTISTNTTANIDVYYYDLNRNYIINKGAFWGTEATFIPSANGYIRIRVSTSDLETKIQIEEGSKTDYVQHEETKTYITLPQPLQSVPNGTKDEVCLDTKTYTKKISDEKIINCSLNFEGFVNGIGTNSDLAYAFIRDWGITNNAKQETTGSARGFDGTNIYSHISGNFNVTTGYYTRLASNHLYVVVPKNKLSTVDLAGFNAYLTANPITYTYQLAIPRVIENGEEGFSVDGKLYSYGEGTTVEISPIDDDWGNFVSPTITLDMPITKGATIHSNFENIVDHDKRITIIENVKTVNGHTVDSDVPSDAKFTDTIYILPSSLPASMITGLPTTLPANGGNSATVNGHTVLTNVPSEALFTDTQRLISDSVSSTSTTTSASSKAVKTAYDKANDVRINVHNNIGTGTNSHSEGNGVASGDYSHAEGVNTIAYGGRSHAEGQGTKAFSDVSHAEGINTIAGNDLIMGIASHAEGMHTQTKGSCSHIMGQYGYINEIGAWGLANGTSNTNLGLGAKILSNGNFYADGTFNSTGADYAEMFEWEDGNLNAEDRVGYFVALDGEKIKIANESDDYILGIVSCNPAILGDNMSLTWKNKYIADEWGRIQYQDVIIPAMKDEEENIIFPEHVETQPMVNSEWDNTEDYEERLKRKEWDAIGMMGKLLVRDDGTCVINGYCKPTDGGIATPSETGYRVMKRINENIILVLLR
ncbi:peptidase G2 autoproteolytic cleavage domain-containing protein [Marinisporobacter balticus]|uniref:Tail fiber-like repeat protein n=1 Tax=Marinisporobacter balticus TaxID=2018667 RepID=A0A4R2KYI6_9FIRM|nr:peptidase G2 autoproteolytic cleavage domain-containing protein [Marinisporobacter balticus]TCO79134.1 tail fiber-like repeat protein [Marinisporobacter balticus]